MFERRYTYTSLPRPFLFLISIILLYLYTKMEHSFPHISLSRTFLTFYFVYLYTLLLYTLYIERNILSRNFYHFSRPFLTLYYTPIIYRRWNTFPAPFLSLYKVNTFTPPLSLLFYSLGKSLRGKVFKNFISIVL